MTIDDKIAADLHDAREKILRVEADLQDDAPHKRIVWGIDKAIAYLIAAKDKMEQRT